MEELDKDTVAKIWAEAKIYYDLGEDLKLDKATEEEARAIQDAHGEDSPKLGMITQYLDTLLPKDWADMDIYQRRSFLQGDTFNAPRETV